MAKSAIVEQYVELVKKGLRTLGAKKDVPPVHESIKAQVKEAYEAKYGEESAE